jgi:hypothetical protein
MLSLAFQVFVLLNATTTYSLLAQVEMNLPNNSDPENQLKFLLDSYRNEAEEIRKADPDKQIVWKKSWLSRFMRAIVRSKALGKTKNATYESSLLQALALANSLPNYEQADLLCVMLMETSKGPIDIFHWLYERAEINNRWYGSTKDLEKLRTSVQIARECIGQGKAVLNIINLKASQRDHVAEKLLYIIGKNAIIAKDNIKIGDDIASQMWAFFKDTYPMLPASAKKRSAETGYSADNIFEHFVPGVIPPGDEAAAAKVLELTTNVLANEKTRRGPSFFCHLCAKSYDPEQKAKYSSFVSKWIKTAPSDPWLSFLKLSLARSYWLQRDSNLALPICIDLKGQESKVLLEADKEEIKEGQGGYYAELLRILIEIYIEKKQFDLASDNLSTLIGLYPKDSSIKIYQAILKK